METTTYKLRPSAYEQLAREGRRWPYEAIVLAAPVNGEGVTPMEALRIHTGATLPGLDWRDFD
jgi:hypothetical protein